MLERTHENVCAYYAFPLMLSKLQNSVDQIKHVCAEQRVLKRVSFFQPCLILPVARILCYFLTYMSRVSCDPHMMKCEAILYITFQSHFAPERQEVLVL